MPDEGLLAGELPPTKQTGQFHPVRHPPFLLIFVTSFFFAVSLSTVGWDQALLLRRRTLQKWDARSKTEEQMDTKITKCFVAYITNRITVTTSLLLYFVGSGPERSEAALTVHPVGQRSKIRRITRSVYKTLSYADIVLLLSD